MKAKVIKGLKIANLIFAMALILSDIVFLLAMRAINYSIHLEDFLFLFRFVGTFFAAVMTALTGLRLVIKQPCLLKQCALILYLWYILTPFLLIFNTCAYFYS